MTKTTSSKTVFGCVTIAAIATLLGGCAMSAGDPQEHPEETAAAISNSSPATCHYVGNLDGCTEVQVCFYSTGGVDPNSDYYYTGLCNGVYTTWGDPTCSGGSCRDVGPSTPE